VNEFSPKSFLLWALGTLLLTAFLVLAFPAVS
jgi:hypothetical protein